MKTARKKTNKKPTRRSPVPRRTRKPVPAVPEPNSVHTVSLNSEQRDSLRKWFEEMRCAILALNRLASALEDASASIKRHHSYNRGSEHVKFLASSGDTVSIPLEGFGAAVERNRLRIFSTSNPNLDWYVFADKAEQVASFFRIETKDLHSTKDLDPAYLLSGPSFERSKFCSMRMSRRLLFNLFRSFEALVSEEELQADGASPELLCGLLKNMKFDNRKLVFERFEGGVKVMAVNPDQKAGA